MRNERNPEEIQITIAATSDLHGHVMPISYIDHSTVETGLAKLATRLHEIRRKAESVIFIDNGDLLQGTPLASYAALAKGDHINPMIQVMNRLGCDAFVPGNHEFNYGLSFIGQMKAQSQFPWLSANIVGKLSGEPYFGCPYKCFDLPGGVRAAVLGLTTAFVPKWEQPAHIDGLAFVSALSAARKWVPLLREKEGADLVIAAYHGGFERNPETGEAEEEETGENEGYRIAKEVKGIDVLLTGHQHRMIPQAFIGETLVVQPGSHGHYIAEIEIAMERRSGSWLRTAASAKLHAAEGAEPDPGVLEWTAASETAAQKWLDKPICQVNGDMRIIDPLQARTEDHPLVEFINRVQMEAAGAPISITSLFDNDAPGFSNQVTMREVAANYPFPNTLKVLRITGADIREALEWTARYFDPYNGGGIAVSREFQYPKAQHFNYDMWEGIEYEMNVSRPVGERIVHLAIKGKPIDPAGEYEVVMNNYRASGGGHYRMFEGKPVVMEIASEMPELIAEYMRAKGTVTAECDRNWRVTHD